jgi:hypothetical protein
VLVLDPKPGQRRPLEPRNQEFAQAREQLLANLGVPLSLVADLRQYAGHCPGLPIV